jgi:ATP-dependent RNA helicase HelY
MAANLVRRYPPDVAHHLLNLSFAQYRADSDVVRLEAQLERTQDALAEARPDATCDRGDVQEFRRLLRESDERARTRPSMTAEVLAALDRVKPGDILVVPGGKSGGRVVVLSTSRRRGGDLRIRAITPDRRLLSLGPKDFPAPPRPVGRVELPTPYTPNNSVFQRRVAAELLTARVATPTDSSGGPRRKSRGEEALAKAEAAASHPVAECPDIRQHLKAADRAERLARDAERLERRIRGRTESLARQFDRVLRVLEAWGYVDGWALTEAGQRLARVYHEADLLVAECVNQGLLDGLDPAEMAGIASTLTYEARGLGHTAPSFPSPKLRDRWGAIDQLASELNEAEDEAGLPLTRRPDPGFIALAHAWAAGEELEQVIAGIADEEVSGGDFVRQIKQLIDLLRQLGDVAPEATGRVARVASDRLFRGVVAASSVVSAGEDDPADDDAVSDSVGAIQ